MAKKSRAVASGWAAERKQLIAESMKAGMTRAEAVAHAKKCLMERDIPDESTDDGGQ